MGEVEPDLRLGLDLVDALDLVFDRVLDGDDLDPGGVELAQRGVQRGGLARAGRAGDQQDAVRLLQHVLELRQELVGEAELVEIQHHRLAIQQTHHHRLAVRGRHRAHAQVELLALHPQHDATVLRQPALGDVELGHDLDAADHRGGEVDRRAFALDQHAVDAIAHLQPVLERFDVDVGRAQLDRALDHQVHQPDHRRFRGQVAQVLDVVQIAALAFGGFDDRAHRAAALAVPALDQVVDLRAQSDQRTYVALHRQAHCVDDVGVLRIGHQHLDRGVAFGHRADVELLHELGGEQHAFGRQLGHVLDADQRQTEHLGDGLGVVALGHQAQPRQQGQQAAAGLFLQAARATEIGVLEAAFRQQRVDDARICARVCPCVPGVVDDCVHGCPEPLAGPPLGMSVDFTSSLALQVPGDDADSKLYPTLARREYSRPWTG